MVSLSIFSYFILCLNTLNVFCDNDHELNVKGAIQYNSKDFDENVVKSPHFIMFFAPWCGHCKRLHPTWDQLAEKYNAQDPRTITISKVDCTTDTPICSDQGVNGYPTLKIYGKGSLEGIKYKGPRELASLEKFIAEQLDLDFESDDESAPQPTSGLYELTDETFKSQIGKGKSFIKFYAPWCGHCQRLAPTWSTLASTFGYDDRITIGKVDCTKYKDSCKEYNVKGYPTLIWIEDGNEVARYNGDRSLDDLKKFVVDQLVSEEETEEPSHAESPVVTLTSLNFENAISSGVTFVKYFAPWCGHCKRLAPIYEELGKEFMGNGQVTIGKVDCTLDLNKELCAEQKVTGFPTLQLYKDGKPVEQYRGDRSLKDMAKFVSSRVPHEEL